ncbi:metallophosphoesterase (TIGR03767 family) [Arthrobacter sp. B3I9]|nr:metallophosphoesterase (TIGR03767 family) [Arthrobacter sp. B3I9]
MQVSRRDVIRWASTGAIGAALLGLSESGGVRVSEAEGAEPPKADASALTRAEQGAQLTTLDSTITFGSRRVQRLPYRRLAAGPGVETLVREELQARGRTPSSKRTALATFGHITDTHVLDAANPGRLTFLWQYFDFSEEFPSNRRFRPQELLTVHVLDAMLRKLNAVHQGPVSRRPLDCLVTTGDLTNASALCELSAAVGVFKGHVVTSHPAGDYKGVQDYGRASLKLSHNFWHPEPEVAGSMPDNWKTIQGFPTVQGLLEAAIRPIPTEGTRYRWYTGLGNHDEAGRSTSASALRKADFIERLRLGDRLPLGLPQGMTTSAFWSAAADPDDKKRQALMDSMPYRRVPASKLRRPFSKGEFMDTAGEAGKTRFGSSAGPSGDSQPYYTFEVSPGVVGIMLNTASPDGGTKAVLDAEQAEWLERQLCLVSREAYDSKGRRVESNVQNRLVILFSHHPLSSFDLDHRSVGDPRPSLDRSAVLELISRFPNVVAWMNGHAHWHRVTPHKGKYEHAGGFWEITTASLIDFPQQSRIIEIIDNGDGTLSIIATLVDHSTPESVAYDGPHSARSLAALSLELASNRPGLDHAAAVGTSTDQNVNLLLRKPF